MRAYTAFVPSLVMERIAKDPGEPAKAYEEKFPAALLFVDIVGYVKLTGVTHKGVVQRERLGTAMERLQNKGSAGRLDAEDAMGIAGLTGRTHDTRHPNDEEGCPSFPRCRVLFPRKSVLVSLFFFPLVASCSRV